MDMPASSSAPAPSKQQQFWKLKRGARRRKLPQQMALSGGMFFCLAAMQAQYGVFDGWRSERGAASQAVDAPVPGAWRTDAITAYSGSSSSYTAGRRLSALNITICDTAKNSSSVLPPLPDLEADKGTATLFFVVITLYMFLGLAIVCDSFFEASLSAICEAQNLKDDVAGATWMAAGGSAPELMTSFIGVFASQSDIGFGTIVGSAVFNVLFVIACCAFVAPNLKLTWWPLARDAAYYCYSLALIAIFASNDLQITWYESAILLLSYIGYIMVMYFNEKLEVWVMQRIEINKKTENPIQKLFKKIIDNPVFALCLYGIILANAVVIILEVMDFNTRAAQYPCVCGVYDGAWALQLENTPLGLANLLFNIFFIVEMAFKLYTYGFFGYWGNSLNCFDGALVFLIVVEFILSSSATATAQTLADMGASDIDHQDSIGVGVARLLRTLKFVRFVRAFRVLRLGRLAAGAATAVMPTAEGESAGADAEAGKVSGEKPEKPGVEAAAEEEEDEDDDEPFNPFEIWGGFDSPGAIFGRVMWLVGLPLSVAFWLTIPDCRRPMFKKFWFITFFNCIAWIAILSTIMVWMVERFGSKNMYNIPESIMGIFILAAGTSIPDCLSSVAVARRGHGDMAVSSSIGSNIFDVLLGLPLPWFIYTAIVWPITEGSLPEAERDPNKSSTFPVESATLAFMILMLFVMVALVITTVHLSGWILSVRLGMGMMALYFVFLILALLLDRGVIFPDCISNA